MFNIKYYYCLGIASGSSTSIGGIHKLSMSAEDGSFSRSQLYNCGVHEKTRHSFEWRVFKVSQPSAGFKPALD